MGGESMWKLLFIALVISAIWKFYPQIQSINLKNVAPPSEFQTTTNLKEAETQARTTFKKEKTIFTVNQRRDELNKDAQEAMDKY